MPIGIQRLNAPRPQPSSQIIFIKPLPGPTSAYAQDFLERIAAISHPIMKANHLSVMSLEEYEPNPEFIGRNFNAGEVIQLVLRAPYSGHWLSFRSVQMVMMHELAHCVQMNHSGAFWKVNNQFKGELRDLWTKGYTGDGLWGRGQTLLSGGYDTGRHMENEIMPENLCGGTFRSSRRGKRKRGGEKPKESYAERQQRRIKKKFGLNGVALGDDGDARVKLEKGKKPKGKPRVAGSKRGRELRAAAALARLGQMKQEETIEEHLFSDSETQSDGEDLDSTDAFDLNGSLVRDGRGREMFKVCEDENQNDIHVKQEIKELQELNDSYLRTKDLHTDGGGARLSGISVTQSTASQHSALENCHTTNHLRMEDIPLYDRSKDHLLAEEKSAEAIAAENRSDRLGASGSITDSRSSRPSNTAHEPFRSSEMICPVCSMSNEASSHLCIACSHVLDTSKVIKYWRCQRNECRNSKYINASDCGLCGICGASRDEAKD